MVVINRWICYNPAVHTVCQRLLLHRVPVFSQYTSCQTNQWQRNQLRWSKRTVSPRRHVKTSAERSRHISRIWALERLVVDRFFFFFFKVTSHTSACCSGIHQGFSQSPRGAHQEVRHAPDGESGDRLDIDCTGIKKPSALYWGIHKNASKSSGFY